MSEQTTFEPKLVGRRPRDTPAELRSTAGVRHRLPPDLLQQASRRLEIIAWIGAALWVLGPLLGHLALGVTGPADPRWSQFLHFDYVAMAALAVTLALLFYLRRGDRDPELVMDLGLAYMVFGAFAIGILMHWGKPAESLGVNPVITWTGPLMLMYAAIVPVSPWKMLTAGFLAASMDPLGMIFWKAAGQIEFGPLSNALVMHYPNYMILGVAVVISHVVTRLGQQVAKERELGSYRLGDLLGQGGMGEVYRATHRMLARPAAIKLIRREVLTAANGSLAQVAIARFKREAEAAAKLRSPHTVELYDFGVTEDQTLYYVMELLEGMDLESLVQQQGPVSPARAIYLLRQVCASLEEAHARGLVHRDIKPANIHVGRLGLQNDFVKVLDFGLVKSLTGPSDERSFATAAGLALGTPAYMAPEMALGEEVDGRTDIYAVGCVAYFTLTGQAVFEAETPMQMVARHLHAKPIPPSQRAGLPLPEALEQLVLACLAKEPKDRPQSAAALAQSLEAIPIEQWTEQRAAEWWRVNRPA